MKYSFVIPTYNNKVLLRNTLAALNGQTGFGRDDYEAIVVDDGSNDGTRDYIKGVNENYSLKYVYIDRSLKSCRSRTRNTGWKKADGKIVVFIDSDIIVRNDYLLQLDRCFKLNGDIFIVGNRLMTDRPVEYGEVVSGEVYDKFRFGPGNFQLLEFRYFLYAVSSYNTKAIMCSWIHTYSCNLVVPRKWLEVVGGFDENFKGWGMEDVEIGYSLSTNGVQMIINPKLEVLHQYHGPRNDLVVEKAKIPAYEKNIDYFLEKHPRALRMGKKIAYRFLEGDVSSSKIFMEPPLPKIEMYLRDSGDLKRIKKQILELRSVENIKPIVYDCAENTDIDIWIQLLDFNKNNAVRYYPMSKKIDLTGMMNYIESVKRTMR